MEALIKKTAPVLEAQERQANIEAFAKKSQEAVEKFDSGHWSRNDMLVYLGFTAIDEEYANEKYILKK